MDISFNNAGNLTKSDYLNFKYFVLSLSFTGRTSISDQILLVGLIEQHIQYTNGMSGVRPGTRKMRTETNLNNGTVSRSLERLREAGWLEILSRGNRTGKATVLRVAFLNPPATFDPSIKYEELVHPLATYTELWTKYALGIKCLAILNFLHKSQNEAPDGHIRARIIESTGISRETINKSIDWLQAVGLIEMNGKKVMLTQSVYEHPISKYLEICDLFSIEHQREIRIKQHNYERGLSASVRSEARKSAISAIIAKREQDKYERQTQVSGF